VGLLGFEPRSEAGSKESFVTAYWLNPPLLEAPIFGGSLYLCQVILQPHRTSKAQPFY